MDVAKEIRKLSKVALESDKSTFRIASDFTDNLKNYYEQSSSSPAIATGQRLGAMTVTIDHLLSEIVKLKKLRG